MANRKGKPPAYRVVILSTAPDVFVAEVLRGRNVVHTTAGAADRQHAWELAQEWIHDQTAAAGILPGLNL